MKERARNTWRKYSDEIVLASGGGLLSFSLYLLGINIASGNKSGIIGSGCVSALVALRTVIKITDMAEERHRLKEEVKWLRDQHPRSTK